MAQAIDQPEKQGYLLVTFRYGAKDAPQYKFFTDWDSRVAAYVPVPNMEVTIPKNSGGMGKEECIIDVPLEADQWVEDYTDDVAREDVFVTVTEVTRSIEGGPAATNLVLFRGQVLETEQCPEGEQVGRFTCLSVKSQLDVEMGSPCMHTCPYVHGSPETCQINLDLHRETGSFDTIDGQVCTLATPNAAITAPTSPGGDVATYWERGYVERDGLRIGIMRWKATDPTVFVLRDVPPDDWDTGNLTFTPGCHKTIVVDPDTGVVSGDCVDVWDNESNNGAIGIAMLPRNPLIEE